MFLILNSVIENGTLKINWSYVLNDVETHSGMVIHEGEDLESIDNEDMIAIVRANINDEALTAIEGQN